MAGPGFRKSSTVAPISISILRESRHHSTGNIWLKVNGEMRQQRPADMIWNVPTPSVSFRILRTQPGDLIFTGTPAGVGAVKRGDQMVRRGKLGMVVTWFVFPRTRTRHERNRAEDLAEVH